jgi:hypothetical protein
MMLKQSSDGGHSEALQKGLDVKLIRPQTVSNVLTQAGLFRKASGQAKEWQTSRSTVRPALICNNAALFTLQASVRRL